MHKIFFSISCLTIATALNAQQATPIYLADNGLTVSGNSTNKKVSLGGTLLNAQTAIDFGSSNSSSNFLIKKGSSNYFFIANGGNVGIGTTSPSALFHTNGSVRFEGLGSQISYTRILAVDNTGLLAYRDASTLGGGGSVTLNSTQIAFGNVSNQISSSSDFTWNGTRLMLGNFTAGAIPTPVSINTGATFGSNTPGTPGNLKLKLFDDNTNVYGLGISSGLMEYQVPTGADHRFYVAGTELMRLANTGNIGIGTSNPTNKFHVNGSVKLEGLTTNNALTNILAADANGNLSWRDASTLGGGGSFINNQNAAAQTADMWISGAGRFEGGLESWKGSVTNVRLGWGALNANTSGTSNIGIGYASLWGTTSGNSNIALGAWTSSGVTTGVQNINIGGGGLSAGASYNVGVGSVALGNASGQFNVGLGQQALTNLTTGSSNIGIGYFASGSTSTGNNNLSIGNGAGYSNNGSSNIFLGFQTGYYNTGSGNVFLGNQAGHLETGDNKLYIDNSTTNSPLVYGDFASNLFRVNGQLHVNGSAKLEGLTTNNSLTKILAADASGNLSWRDASTLGGGGGGGLLTADNGLSANTFNVQLGGTLLQNTSIATGANSLTISSATANTNPLKVTATTGNYAILGEVVTGGGILGHATGSGSGVVGQSDGGGPGVYGVSSASSGLYGMTNTGTAVAGLSNSTGLAGILSSNSNVNNSVVEILRLVKQSSSGLGVNGIGASMTFYTVTNDDMPGGIATYESNAMKSLWSNVSETNRTSKFIITGVNNAVTSDLFTLSGNGSTRLNKYGTGTFTGTPVYALQVDANGNLIEGAIGGGGSSQWLNAGSDIHYDGGNVGIGIANVPTGYKLAVAGNIITEKVRVKLQSSIWPDYVFHSKYELPSLKDLELFIQKNKHLPDVPSAADVEANGLDLGDNQSILLKKVEELTLYIIEINKKVDKLTEENVLLKKKLETNKK